MLLVSSLLQGPPRQEKHLVNTTKTRVFKKHLRCEKLEPSFTAGGEYKMVHSHSENSLAVPQNTSIDSPYDPAIPYLEYLPKRTKNICSHKTVYMNADRNIIRNSHRMKTV